MSESITEDDFVWIQDYQLLEVGKFMREQGVEQPLSFFLHIPFPSPDLFRRRYGIHDAPLLLDLSTQKCHGKGSIHTLEAVALVQSQMPEVQFASIGASSPEWAEAVAQSDARVLDLGRVDEDTKRSAFAAADVFVLSLIHI